MSRRSSIRSPHSGLSSRESPRGDGGQKTSAAMAVGEGGRGGGMVGGGGGGRRGLAQCGCGDEEGGREVWMTKSDGDNQVISEKTFFFFFLKSSYSKR